MVTKQPMNEYVVSGIAKLRGVTCIVHAYDRQDAVAKANAGQFIGAVEYDTAEISDYDFSLAELNVEDI